MELGRLVQRFVIRSREGFPRLVWIKNKATAEFWISQWQNADMGEALAGAISDSDILPVFLRYLKPHDRVLEAGCGQGQWVEALSMTGFNVVGVDFAVPSLAAAASYYQRRFRFVAADIHALPFPKGSFDKVISLGVVEHFFPEPNPLIEEMARILRPGGILFLSVPYYNWVRRLKFLLSGSCMAEKIAQEPPGFYQFAFTLREMAVILAASGFNLVETFPYSTVKGLKDEWTMLGGLRPYLRTWTTESKLYFTAKQKNGSGISSSPPLARAKRLFKDLLVAITKSTLLTKIAGHMIMTVAMKH